MVLDHLASTRQRRRHDDDCKNAYQPRKETCGLGHLTLLCTISSVDIRGMDDRVEEIDDQRGDETHEDIDGHGRSSLITASG